MNSPDKNNYIQYVNKNGIVKARNVVFDNDGITTKFTVSGINEDFFIFAVYENNIQRFCVGLENLDNTDMLGFINSNMVDLSCIPHYAYLPQYTVVELSYNDEYVNKNKFGDVSSDAPDLSFVNALNNFVAYDEDQNIYEDSVQDNALNVVNLHFKSDDEIWLTNFCKVAYPNVPFKIKAFSHFLAFNKQLSDPNNKRVYYSKLLPSKVMVHTDYSFGGSLETPTYGGYHKAQGEKVVYKELFYSSGEGSWELTPVDYVELVTGYVAIFQTVPFIGG